jgi:hypothetical protein
MIYGFLYGLKRMRGNKRNGIESRRDGRTSDLSKLVFRSRRRFSSSAVRGWKAPKSTCTRASPGSFDSAP